MYKPLIRRIKWYNMEKIYKNHIKRKQLEKMKLYLKEVYGQNKINAETRKIL